MIARRFKIRRVSWDEEFPWYFQEVTHGDDCDDYGSVETFERAIECVRYSLENPEPYYYPELGGGNDS